MGRRERTPRVRGVVSARRTTTKKGVGGEINNVKNVKTGWGVGEEGVAVGGGVTTSRARSCCVGFNLCSYVPSPIAQMLVVCAAVDGCGFLAI